ncbi:MAG TPA: hypothetical protein VN538_00315 [Clostridia bacterium]|nr:hypothetical protein [Clostridia bacterium]
MNEQVLREHYKKRGFSAELTDEAVAAVRALEERLHEQEETLESAGIPPIRAHIRSMIESGGVTLEALLALGRYFYLTGRNDIYVYFTSLLGAVGVVESIADRLTLLEGAEVAQELVGTLPKPPLGSEPADYPAFTRALMERLEQQLPESTVCRALAGNHHRIPAEEFEDERKLYLLSGSMEEYLRAAHKNQVEALKSHADAGTVWFEQVITQDVVDFIAANQEIQSAVKVGDTLYTTKIPYDPARYLAETDDTMRRYYACHCPFVREAILRGEPEISGNWCYCSGGFVKYPYEVILGRELRVELLQSVLKGDPVCRFAIHLDSAEAE